jgi:hypothetical protein
MDPRNRSWRQDRVSREDRTAVRWSVRYPDTAVKYGDPASVAACITDDGKHVVLRDVWGAVGYHTLALGKHDMPPYNAGVPQARRDKPEVGEDAEVPCVQG